MLGLSISAIGIRPIPECLEIFDTFVEPLQLDYLELAIGSNCQIDYPYPTQWLARSSILDRHETLI